MVAAAFLKLVVGTSSSADIISAHGIAFSNTIKAIQGTPMPHDFIPIPKIYEWLTQQGVDITLIESIQDGDMWTITLKNGAAFKLHDYHDIPGVMAQNPGAPTGYYASYIPPVYKPSDVIPMTNQVIGPPTPPPYKNTVNELEQLLGPIAKYPCKCPSVTYHGKHGNKNHCGHTADLWHMVQHLNDVHRWKRERIADWMESLDIDLTIAHVLKCEWCGKTYHGLTDTPPLVCSEQCGEKLAKVLLENPELEDLPDNKRAIMIQSYRELDELEEFNG